MYTHLVAAFLFISIFLYRLLKWTLVSFGGVTSDQVLFHLFTNTAGAPAFISNKLMIEAGVKPVAAVLVFYFLIWIAKKFPKLTLAIRWVAIIISCILLAAVLNRSYKLFFELGVNEDFIRTYKNLDWMRNFYKEPVITKKPEKNLVWIYFESLEAKDVDHENFPINGDTDFESQYRSLNGTGWTFAGILSSQCGIPLILDPTKPRGGYLSGTTCLPDILSQQGYEGHFLGGAPLSFSNKGTFLNTHGVKNTVGKAELQEILKIPPPSVDKYWGYDDDQLLDLLESDVLKLHAKRQKFYYMALTLDTHGPFVYSPKCKDMGYANTQKDIFSCGLKRIHQLISRWESAGVLDNTTVVVTGDHPAMRTYNFNWRDLFNTKEIKRESVYVYIRPANSFSGSLKKSSNVSMNHFDLFPTVFYSIGGEFSGQSAGLGLNTFKSPSLSEKFNENEFNYLLSRPSAKYDERWK